MRIFESAVIFLTNVNKWVAFCILAIMMISVTFFSLSRSVGYPMVGDVELVQMSMVVLIVGSLAFTERDNAHIAVGIFIDHAPKTVQWILDLIGRVLTVAFCFMACWVLIYKMNYMMTSSLFSFPLYPFKMMMIFGFFSWGLEALVKLVKSFFELKTLNEAPARQ